MFCVGDRQFRHPSVMMENNTKLSNCGQLIHGSQQDAVFASCFIIKFVSSHLIRPFQFPFGNYLS